MMFRGYGSQILNRNGVGEYFEAGLGEVSPSQEFALQEAPKVVLDLQDPEAVLQLKSAMAMAPFMMPIVFGEGVEADFDEVFFRNRVWDAKATKFARLWLDEYKKAFPNISNADVMLVTPHLYPSTTGVLVVLALLGYKQPADTGIDFSQFPLLTSFYDATEGNPERGKVKAPPFSTSESKTIQANTLALAGLGVLGVLALGLIFGGKKKRR